MDGTFGRMPTHQLPARFAAQGVADRTAAPGKPVIEPIGCQPFCGDIATYQGATGSALSAPIHAKPCDRSSLRDRSHHLPTG